MFNIKVLSFVCSTKYLQYQYLINNRFIIIIIKYLLSGFLFVTLSALLKLKWLQSLGIKNLLIVLLLS